ASVRDLSCPLCKCLKERNRTGGTGRAPRDAAVSWRGNTRVLRLFRRALPQGVPGKAGGRFAKIPESFSGRGRLAARQPRRGVRRGGRALRLVGDSGVARAAARAVGRADERQ